MRSVIRCLIRLLNSVRDLLGRRVDLERAFQSVDPSRRRLGRAEMRFREMLLAHAEQAGRSGRMVLILALDISSSIETIREEYARGYSELIKRHEKWNPFLLVIGFHSQMTVLYSGPLAEAPRYRSKDFTVGAPGVLGHGTCLYRAIVTCGNIAREVHAICGVVVTWLTDGLDSCKEENQRTSVLMATAMCSTLRRRAIPYLVIGAFNPWYCASRKRLDALLAILNGKSGLLRRNDGLSKSVAPVRAFQLATELIEESRLNGPALADDDPRYGADSEERTTPD